MDWSDHALWWPDKNRWLKRSRSTLDQYGVQADAKLHFTPMHKNLRIQLPDLQIMDMRTDFSSDVFHAVMGLCKEIGMSSLGLFAYIWSIDNPFVGPSEIKFGLTKRGILGFAITSFGPIRRLNLMCIVGYAHIYAMFDIMGFPAFVGESDVISCILSILEFYVDCNIYNALSWRSVYLCTVILGCLADLGIIINKCT